MCVIIHVCIEYGCMVTHVQMIDTLEKSFWIEFCTDPMTRLVVLTDQTPLFQIKFDRILIFVMQRQKNIAPINRNFSTNGKNE